MSARLRRGHPFFQGLLVDLGNPKAALFLTAFFAAALPPDASGPFLTAMMLTVAAIVFTWYLVLAWLLSTPRPSAVYRRATRRINKASALAIGTLGLRIAVSD